MTEGARTDERPSVEVTRVVLEVFGLELQETMTGYAGEESIGWHVRSNGSDLFVQRFPPWRATSHLIWCDDVSRAAATLAPECVHAIPSDDGRRAIETPDGPVMVFPFVGRTHPDDVRAFADEAAELLARIHLGIVNAWVDPGAGDLQRSSRVIRTDPPQLRDPELDAWEQKMATAESSRFPIHGDYYAGNLLVTDRLIAGVIDWAEARLEHHAQEISWAAWEFCQNDAGDDLVDTRAARFLRTYSNVGGPADISPPFDPIPWIRQRLRREAGRWLGDPASGQGTSAYHDAQLRAFVGLRGRSLNE